MTYFTLYLLKLHKPCSNREILTALYIQQLWADSLYNTFRQETTSCNLYKWYAMYIKISPMNYL